jgi:hypothetical protein
MQKSRKISTDPGNAERHSSIPCTQFCVHVRAHVRVNVHVHVRIDVYLQKLPDDTVNVAATTPE